MIFPIRCVDNNSSDELILIKGVINKFNICKCLHYFTVQKKQEKTLGNKKFLHIDSQKEL